MITITYTPTGTTLMAYVPYDKLNRFNSINIECILLPYSRTLKRDTEKQCFVIEIKVPHNDIQAIIKHYQLYKKSITLIVL